MNPPDCGVPALFTSKESGVFEMRRSDKILPFPSECYYSIRIDDWNRPLMLQITSMTVSLEKAELNVTDYFFPTYRSQFQMKFVIGTMFK